MKKFKKRDKVRLVKHGRIDWESLEWTKRDGLKVRQVYVVSTVDDYVYSDSIRVKGTEHNYAFHVDHFTKVKK